MHNRCKYSSLGQCANFALPNLSRLKIATVFIRFLYLLIPSYLVTFLFLLPSHLKQYTFFLTMWEKYQPSGTTLASADFPASSSAFHSPSAYHFPISAYPAYHYSTIITTPSYYCIFWYILQKRGKKDDKFPRLSVFQLLPNISAVNSSFSSMMQCLLVVGSHFRFDLP